MKSWDSAQYLRFEAERTRPCRDLIAAITLRNPRHIIDLGCGPGNSTCALADRWRDASITGLDSSPEMLATARADYSHIKWLSGDISSWSPEQTFDIVFSNAALQWVPEHDVVYPHLLEQVSPGGVLAVQVPVKTDSPAQSLMQSLAASPEWRSYFPKPPRDWHVHGVEFYYDILAKEASKLDLWITDYQHVLDSPADIAEWYRGTGLRPFLKMLPDEATQARFLADYATGLEKAYNRRADGKILFPFRRMFLIAER